MDDQNQTPLQQSTDAHVALDAERKGLTRRQFLTYTLGGTGAFMGTLMIAPLVVSAFDPLHRSAGGGGMSKTTWKVSDFNEKLPTHVTFSQHIDDAWNSSDQPNDVYVIKYQKKLMIMSHVCTHLGCHVDGSIKNNQSIKPEFGNGVYWFHCPCHGSLYNIYGVNSPSSPAPRPLNLFQYQVDSQGYVQVGQDFQRTDATWDHNLNPTVD